MFNSIVLTGASGGIGAALASRMAAPGVSMLLIARREDALREVAALASKNGAKVETAILDVTDAAAMARVLAAYDQSNPIDLVIANAGISAGLEPGRAPEAPGVSRRLVEANYMGVLNTIEPVLPLMLARGRGHLALMSSLAALRPFPDMPSYSATKAAVRAYGTALRGAWRGAGIDVSVICPGFVTSPMSQRHHGLKPFEISAERAAGIVQRGLARRRAEITFPWQLALLIWLSNWLPPRLSDWFVQGFKADIAKGD
ncbi:SDR family NAD(P)-dependent oxidoreductase [Rhodobacteraceae bacterium NNCM2]|nr:SDR family NAD(P)-dependent oxidoreductase [Coraliihabitans acroporae]